MAANAQHDVVRIYAQRLWRMPFILPVFSDARGLRRVAHDQRTAEGATCSRIHACQERVTAWRLDRHCTTKEDCFTTLRVATSMCPG